MTKNKKQLFKKNIPDPKQGKAINQSRKKETPKKSSSKFWPFASIVLIITFVVFLPSLTNKFVNWDDPENLLQNETLKLFSTQWNWGAVKTIFTSDVIGGYNPLSIFSFAVEKYLFAPDPASSPFIFHFDNLLMHLLTTLFVLLLMMKLGVGSTAAIIGALLFGIHPMRVESVAWVSERKDVLYAMFFFAALIAYVNFIQHDRNKSRWYLLAILFSVFSYFAKIQAVTLPLSMVAIDFFLKRNWRSPKILIIEKLPWWILSLVIGYINIQFLSEGKAMDPTNTAMGFTFIDRLALGAYAYIVYLVKWVYPYLMSPLYPYPEKVSGIVYALLALVPLAITAFLLWSVRNKKTTLIFGWMFFTFNIMFLLQIVAAGQGFLADRFTYVAYFGLFFIVAKTIDTILTRNAQKKAALIGGFALYLALFAFMTTRQTKVWAHGGVLWEHVKSHYPENPLAWSNAAYYYRESERDFQKSITYYQKSIELKPDQPAVHNSFAKTYFNWATAINTTTPAGVQSQQKLLKSSIAAYTEADKQDSLQGRRDSKTTSDIFINRGIAHGMSGNNEDAYRDMTRGIQFSPTNKNGYLSRSLLFLNMNRPELAINDYDEYLKLDPYDADIYYERGMCKNNIGKFSDAIPDLNKAIQLKNNVPMFYVERAKAYKGIGDATSARNDVMQVQRLGGRVPEELLR